MVPYSNETIDKHNHHKYSLPKQIKQVGIFIPSPMNL